MHLPVKSRAFLGFCLAILVVLNIGNAASVYLRFVKGADFGGGIIPLFDFDHEGNFPTLFNGGLLGFAAALAAAIGLDARKTGKGLWISWMGVAGVLAFLTFDELCGIHDALFIFLEARTETEGGFSWPWVIPYAALTVVVAGMFIRFFFALPVSFRIRFAVAAVLYVGGAIGMEMVAAANWVEGSGGDLAFGIFYTIEENLEMLGCLLTVTTLMKWIREQDGPARIGIDLA